MNKKAYFKLKEDVELEFYSEYYNQHSRLLYKKGGHLTDTNIVHVYNGDYLVNQIDPLKVEIIEKSLGEWTILDIKGHPYLIELDGSKSPIYYSEEEHSNTNLFQWYRLEEDIELDLTYSHSPDEKFKVIYRKGGYIETLFRFYPYKKGWIDGHLGWNSVIKAVPKENWPNEDNTLREIVHIKERTYSILYKKESDGSLSLVYELGKPSLDNPLLKI